MVDLPHGVLGPPWAVVPKLTAHVLALDPPAAHNCRARAVYCLGKVHKCRSDEHAAALASYLNAKTRHPAEVLRGSMTLKSGRRYWPFAERVAKADPPSPLDPADRALMASRISTRLRRSIASTEREAVAEASSVLNRAWSTGPLSAEELEELASVVGGISTSASLEDAVRRTGGNLRTVAERSHRLSEGTLGRVDARAVQGLITSLPLMAAANIERQLGVWAQTQLQSQVDAWLRQGLSDLAISRRATTALAQHLAAESRRYFFTAANALVARASSYGQLHDYRQAGLLQYRWESTMDSKTCNVCRYLHGQVFSVDTGFSQLDRVRLNDDTSEVFREGLPWYRERGGSIYLAPRQAGAAIGPAVADVLQSAVGVDGQRGEFRPFGSVSELGGTLTPPAHGLCRCLTVPVI